MLAKALPEARPARAVRTSGIDPVVRVLPELVESTSGLILGDRNYHSPRTKEELARGMGVELLAPYSTKQLDPNPKRSALLSRLR